MTALYRHFDKDENLLYVGVSLSAMHRLSQHKRSSIWAGDAVKMTTEYFDDRALALEAEKQAIKAERPIYNVRYNKEVIDIEKKEIAYRHETGIAMIVFTAKHGAARSLLDYLARRMDGSNSLTVSNSALAELLGMSLSSVNKNIRILKDNNIIKTVRTGNASIFYVNAAIATCTQEKYRKVYKLDTTVILSGKEARHQANLFANRDEIFAESQKQERQL